MDEIALLKQQINTLKEENELLRSTLVVKDVNIDVCKCGVPHKLYILGNLYEPSESCSEFI